MTAVSAAVELRHMDDKKKTVSASSAGNKQPGAGVGLISFRQQVIGIDIGAGYIKLLHLRRSGEGYSVVNCVTRAVPAGIKDNPDEKKKLTAKLINEFFADSRLKDCAGKLVLYGKGVYVFFISVPNLSKKDLRGAVSLELKKRLPPQADINSIAFDFFVNGSLQDEHSATLQVTCIAIDKALIEENISFLKANNVLPVSINVVPDVLGNLLSYCAKPAPEKTVALFEMGANISLLNFYRAGMLVFSREIPMGGDHLTQAVAKGLTAITGVPDISLDDAEKIKRTFGIPMTEEGKIEYLTDFGAVRGEQILAMIRPQIERLVMEISRTFNYYSKTFRTGNIEDLYLAGGGSRLKNLEKILKANVEGVKRVESLNILKIIKGWADKGVLRQEMVMEQAVPHLSAAFGICLGGGGKVNLLPVKEQIEQKMALVTTALKVFFPLVCVVTLLLYGLTYANGVKYKALSSGLNVQMQSLEGSSNQVREYFAAKTRLEQKVETLKKTRGRQPQWWGALKELSIITPPEVLLRKINVPFLPGGKEARLFGRISSKYTIVDIALSQYVQALEESPFFSDVKTVSSEKEPYASVPSAVFEISAKLEY